LLEYGVRPAVGAPDLIVRIWLRQNADSPALDASTLS